ncbi:MAG: CAP domain-containing protein [Oscillospiraceae bacterium]
MNRYKIFNTGIFLAVFMSVALAAPSASAGWEQGITVTPAAVIAAAPVEGQEEDASKSFKAEVIRLINIERADKGLCELQEMPALNAPADLRAEESAVSFSHTRPNGESCSTVYSDYGLNYKSAGENLAYGYSTPAALVAAWMASDSHRANILSEAFSYVAVGYYMGENGTLCCSQIFYTPLAQIE